MCKEKGGAINWIESVQKNSPDDDRYERKNSSKWQDYFVLKVKKPGHW